MDKPSYKSDFVNVNGIRLHYLDWGGSGETLLFLTGMGCSAHLFHPFAARFTDNFRVLALTRRGQGESDYPETGYDPDTLIDDIYDFLAFHKIEKVILAGHSLAGIELTHFTKKFPDRVLKLIYLDSVYDFRDRHEIFSSPMSTIQPPEPKEEFESVEEYIAYYKYIIPNFAEIWNESWDKQATTELTINAQGKFVEKATSSIAKQLIEVMKAFDPSQANIKVPVLFFDAQSHPFRRVLPEFYTEEQKKLQLEFDNEKLIPSRRIEMNKLRNNIPHAKIIEIPEGHHYCFIAQEELVYDEMIKFLQLA